MNNAIIDINKLYTLLSAFEKKAKEEDLFKHERAYFLGGISALQQILVDNNYAKRIKYEELSKESGV